MENGINFGQLALFMLFAGLPVFLLARLIQIFVLYSYKIPPAGIVVILIISQIVSLVLETVIWKIFKNDHMFHLLSLPAFAAEVIVTLITFLFIKATVNKWA